MTDAPERAPRFDDLPAFMRHLPLDRRGFPVPWFVPWVDGVPIFPAMDARKRNLAWGKRLCWVCGQKVGRVQAFVIGPMCVVNGASAEPPCHPQCARFSARHCPFMANPAMGRVGEHYKGQRLDLDSAPGEMITRNPGVAAVYGTLKAGVFNDGKGSYLFNIGKCHSIEWYARGRAATRAEVVASIQSGLPALKDMALADPNPGGALIALGEALHDAMRLVPAEPGHPAERIARQLRARRGHAG